MPQNSYDKLYSRGGFKYSPSLWLPRIKKLQDDINLHGRILDAPCGDGFWGRLLRRCNCKVVGTDLSSIGVKKANGILWDLNLLNPSWLNQFDWVFCRGISHLHKENIDSDVFSNLLLYAEKVLVIYSTNQSNKYIGPHFHHTRKALDNLFEQYGLEKSFMRQGSYHAILMDSNCNNCSKT